MAGRVAGIRRRYPAITKVSGADIKPLVSSSTQLNGKQRLASQTRDLINNPRIRTNMRDEELRRMSTTREEQDRTMMEQYNTSRGFRWRLKRCPRVPRAATATCACLALPRLAS